MKMKALLITFICLMSISAYSQQVSIITPTDSVQVKIQANSANSLFTTGGNFLFDDITKVVFHTKPSEKILNTIKTAGIPYSYQQIELDDLYSSKNTRSVMDPDQNDDLKIDIGKFNKTRRTAKQIQLLGMLATGVALAAGEDKVAAGGSLLSLIGFITDMTASEHLSKYE